MFLIFLVGAFALVTSGSLFDPDCTEAKHPGANAVKALPIGLWLIFAFVIYAHFTLD